MDGPSQIKGLRGGVPTYAAQEIPQIDPPEAEKKAIYGWKLNSFVINGTSQARRAIKPCCLN